MEIVTYIDLKADKENISLLKDQISQMDKVSSVVYVTKDKGLKNLIKDLGDDGKAFESLKKDNPLNDTFVIKTKDPKQTALVAKSLENLPYVDKVDYGKDVVKTLFKATNGARLVGFALIIGLALTALLLISNTIKMTIEMRKEEIKIMKLVGASNLFIRLPFVVEGALLGLVGALIPIGIMYVGYQYVYEQYQRMVNLSFASLLNVQEVVLPIAILMLVLSIGIGMIGSAISIRRYLKV